MNKRTIAIAVRHNTLFYLDNWYPRNLRQTSSKHISAEDIGLDNKRSEQSDRKGDLTLNGFFFRGRGYPGLGTFFGARKWPKCQKYSILSFFCKQSILKMGISQPLFLLIDLQLVDNMLPMVGFEQRISGI